MLIYTFIAFIIVAASVPVLAWGAIHVDLVDRPTSQRKAHKGAIPLVGGPAIAIALLVIGMAEPLHWNNLWHLVIGSTVLLGLGVLDDRRIVRSVWKFLIQHVVALFIVIGEARGVEAVGHAVFGPAPWADALSLAVAWLFVVGFINAFNMVDGIDGLAGSLALSMTIALVVIEPWSNASYDVHLILLTLAGAAAGFLLFNARFPWHGKGIRVFLGDSGSMILGLIIAWSIIRVAGTTGVTHHNTGVLAWIVAYPVADTLVVMALRVARGRHPFTPDRWHFHHLLLALGLSVNKVVLLINAFCWLGVGYAVLGHRLGLSSVTLVMSIFAIILVHAGLVLWLRLGAGTILSHQQAEGANPHPTGRQ